MADIHYTVIYCIIWNRLKGYVLYLFIVNRSIYYLWFLNRFPFKSLRTIVIKDASSAEDVAQQPGEYLWHTHFALQGKPTILTFWVPNQFIFGGRAPKKKNAPCLKLDARTGTEPLLCRSVSVGEALSAGWRYSRYTDIQVPSLVLPSSGLHHNHQRNTITTVLWQYEQSDTKQWHIYKNTFHCQY